MKQNTNERTVSVVAALLVFGVFAVGVMGVLLSGASAYRRLTGRDSAAFAERTCTQYIATRLRQAPSPQSVDVTQFGGEDALCITQELEGTAYVTRIYCHEGWLMELFSTADGTFTPEDGEKILPLRAMSLTRQGGLITAALTDEAGITRSVTIYLRGGEEAAS